MLDIKYADSLGKKSYGSHSYLSLNSVITIEYADYLLADGPTV